MRDPIAERLLSLSPAALRELISDLQALDDHILERVQKECPEQLAEHTEEAQRRTAKRDQVLKLLQFENREKEVARD